MHTRSLPIFFGGVFALTLFFVAVAGAQEERTDTEGVGAQAVEVQQQQVPDDQQHAVAVQQQQVLTSQQGLIFAEGEQAAGVQASAQSGALRGEEVETRSTDNDRLIEVIRIPFPNDCRMTKNKVSFVLEDDDGTQADFIEGENVRVNRDGDVLRLTSNDPNPTGPDDPDIRPLNKRGGDRQLDNGGLTVATSTGITCQNDNGSGGGGGGGSNDLDCADFSSQEAAQDELREDRSDPNNLDADNDGRACEDFDYSVGAAQSNSNNQSNNNNQSNSNNTNPDTTTANANTVNPAAEVTAADANLNADLNRPNSGSFRCDLFLRTVRDDTGALRAQYRGDEAIVQRFEQCLSENVLADTIPNRNLPFTGGMPLLLLAAIGLAAIVAGVSVLRAVMRDGR